jgi:hypothetical protein
MIRVATALAYRLLCVTRGVEATGADSSSDSLKEAIVTGLIEKIVPR